MNATTRASVRTALAFLALLAAACDLTTAPAVGDLRVDVHVTGADPDDNRIVVVIDSAMTRPFGAGVSSVAIRDLSPGTHTVELVEFAPNCTAVDSLRRRVTVERNQTGHVTFELACLATGAVVTIHTTGADTERRYKVLIGGVIVSLAAANDSVVMSHLKPGTFTFSLAVPPDSCSVVSPNPAVVQVIFRALAPIHFEVVCGPPIHVPKIAFVTDTIVNARSETWITQANVDGSNAERLELGHSPAWSADGSKLIFSDSRCTEGFYYYYINCTGGLLVLDAEDWGILRLPVTLTATDPTWSPKGDRIAFLSCCGAQTDGLYVARVDGSQVTRLIKQQLASGHPSWSPDGERVVFSCVVRVFADLCIAPVGEDFVVLPRRSDDAAPRTAPAWSPDGRRIAFSTGPQVAVYSLDTDEITRLTDGSEPTWSPDGRMIAFSRPDGLFVMNADGTNVHRITRGPHFHPAWRP